MKKMNTQSSLHQHRVEAMCNRQRSKSEKEQKQWRMKEAYSAAQELLKISERKKQ